MDLSNVFHICLSISGYTQQQSGKAQCLSISNVEATDKPLTSSVGSINFDLGNNSLMIHVKLSNNYYCPREQLIFLFDQWVEQAITTHGLKEDTVELVIRGKLIKSTTMPWKISLEGEKNNFEDRRRKAIKKISRRNPLPIEFEMESTFENYLKLVRIQLCRYQRE